MLFESIIHHFIDKDIKNFVIESDLRNAIYFNEEGIKITSIEDVRSATFYACGLSQEANEPVVLVIKKDYLPSTLTGLTEAWFQRRQLIVLAVGNQILNYDLGYFRNCTSGRYKVQSIQDFEEFKLKTQCQNVPVLFLIEETLPSVTFQYKVNISLLNTNLSPNDKLFVYEPIAQEKLMSENIEYISDNDKYGLISKYMGYCIGSENTCILLTDYSSIKLDMNIFNNRYLDKRFKLIITGNTAEEHVQHWLKQNNIGVVLVNSIEEAIKKVLIAEEAMVVFVKILEVTV